MRARRRGACIRAAPAYPRIIYSRAPARMFRRLPFAVFFACRKFSFFLICRRGSAGFVSFFMPSAENSAGKRLDKIAALSYIN